ncbi:hypothetical protein [Flavobacterium sharifuzzamanii]|uniref:hypothetical protein n=1 Tax=Flavobacterium sharifuzzamanii TaxID=2211133 RepID=UPI000DACD4FF|nr:hypothetical protein [Flavobacterium sharifuzzamanii]KAF2078926.1 DUF3300 domain-containing protein [Flavobacterium sharifuzzamanii]
MKANLLLIAISALVLASCSAQSQTTVYAKNSDISDNLDLRAVASMFGESANLQDFERRLNDPKYQISNLDLNGDDEVDYLRVIESVENRTHVVIIQAVLDRDVYQDVATIDVERDNYNKVSVQIVGNSYLYGANYIYEPVYSVVPVIYTSFWVTNYRPYYSTWYWGYYPTYYSAWRPYPVYRYRNNINVCINVHNTYNYVNTRRSYRAPAIYETRRTYGYERMRPNYSFAERHANTSNRYELDQRRVANRETSRNTYNTNRNYTGRTTSDNGISNRTYAENRNATNRSTVDRSSNSGNNSNRSYNPTGRSSENVSTERSTNRGGYSNNGYNSQRTENSARVQNTQRTDYGNGNTSSTSRDYSNREVSAPRAERSTRSYSENQSSNSNRDYSARPQQSQRSESPRMSQESSRGNQESRGGQSQRDNGSSSRGNGRRG